MLIHHYVHRCKRGERWHNVFLVPYWISIWLQTYLTCFWKISIKYFFQLVGLHTSCFMSTTCPKRLVSPFWNFHSRCLAVFTQSWRTVLDESWTMCNFLNDPLDQNEGQSFIGHHGQALPPVSAVTNGSNPI